MADKMTDDSVKVKTNSNDEHKVLAAVATIPLIGLIMYYAMPDAAPIVKHYAKQSNAVLALNLLITLISFVPFLNLIVCILWVVPLVFWVLLLINALQGNANYKLPVVGEYFDGLLK